MSLAHDTSPSIWTLGDRLAKAIKDPRNQDSKIGVGEMAEHLGVSRNTVTNYVYDHTRPTDAVLRVWAMRTGWPFTFLRDGVMPTESDDGPGGGSDLHNATILCFSSGQRRFAGDGRPLEAPSDDVAA